MSKKRVKKIFRLVVLIAARQIWKLLANLYHLVTEPVLTIKILIREKDKSQIFLISLVFLMPIIAYFLARIIWDYYKYGLVVDKVGMFFTLAVTVQIGLLLYLGYWILKVIGKRHD